MKEYIGNYINDQKRVLDSIPIDKVEVLIKTIRAAILADKNIFIIGNGGSASNASHFATDLGKGVADKLNRRVKVLSLNDNVSWLTAIGNDYCFEDIYVRQLENYGSPGDILICLSVSGNSSNLVQAAQWARANGLVTVALIGGKKEGSEQRLADISEQVISIDTTHYGRAEDAEMTVAHTVCYWFMENADREKTTTIQS